MVCNVIKSGIIVSLNVTHLSVWIMSTIYYKSGIEGMVSLYGMCTNIKMYFKLILSYVTIRLMSFYFFFYNRAD